jgi:hypothetical protein
VGTDENMIRKLVENIGIRVALKYEREVLGIRDARVLTEPEGVGVTILSPRCLMAHRST